MRYNVMLTRSDKPFLQLDISGDYHLRVDCMINIEGKLHQIKYIIFNTDIVKDSTKPMNFNNDAIHVLVVSDHIPLI